MAMRSKTGFAAAMVLASLALALAPGAAQACSNRWCCHKPNIWTNVCTKQVGIKRENGKVVNLGHCGDWKMECIPAPPIPK